MPRGNPIKHRRAPMPLNRTHAVCTPVPAPSEPTAKTPAAEIHQPLLSRLAVVVCMTNKCESAPTLCNGSSPPSKSEQDLTEIDQLLRLYFSVRARWTNLQCPLYAFHPRPLHESVRAQVRELPGLNLVQVRAMDGHSGWIRPESYLHEIPCEYRLVLALSSVAVAEPRFDYTLEAYGTYGFLNYQKFERDTQCLEKLGIPKPAEEDFAPHVIAPARRDSRPEYLWDEKNSDLLRRYYESPGNARTTPRFYPNLSSVALLVHNKHANLIGRTLLQFRNICKHTAQPDESGLLGPLIHHITRGSWTHLPKGHGVLLNERHGTHCVVQKFLTNKGESQARDLVFWLHPTRLSRQSTTYATYVAPYERRVQDWVLRTVESGATQ